MFLPYQSVLVEEKLCSVTFSPCFFVVEVFTGSPGKYVGIVKTIWGFQFILFGELDGLLEQSFYLVGNIDEATVKAMNLEEESKLKK